MSGYVISNALEADGETLLDEVEKDLNLDTTKFVTVEEVDQTIKGHKEFTQPLVVADPTLSTHATNKQYVENYVNSHTGGGGTNAHFQTILTKDIRINTTQQTGEGRVLFTRGENGETIEASIMMDSDGGLAINSNTQPLDLAGSKIINIKDGDDDYDAVTTRQLTNGLNSKLNLSGGSLTGNLSMGGKWIKDVRPPLDDNDVTTKLFVDTVISQLENIVNNKLDKTGGTMTGTLDMGNNHIYNINRLRFTSGGGEVGGSTHHLSFGDKDKLAISSYKPSASGPLQNVDPFIYLNDLNSVKLIEFLKDIDCHGTIKMMDSKTITNVQNPQNPTDVANKQYVDTVKSQLDTKLSLSGGTMTGNTNLNNKFLYNCPNPNNPQDVANKAYVDSKASNSPISLVDGKALLDASGGLWVYGRGLGEDGLITTEGDLRIVSGDAVGMTNIVIKAHNEIQLDAHVAVNMTNSKVYNLPEPTQPTEVATKQYVDSRTSFPITLYRRTPFYGETVGFKSLKFNFGDSVTSGRFLFDIDLELWCSEYSYNPVNYRTHSALIFIQIAGNNGVPVTPRKQFFVPFTFMNDSIYKPGAGLTNEVYYSNANFHLRIEQTFTGTTPLKDLQFQYAWQDVTIDYSNVSGYHKLKDGFSVVSGTCQYTPI